MIENIDGSDFPDMSQPLLGIRLSKAKKRIGNLRSLIRS